MKILSVEFTPSWSWGLVFNAIAARCRGVKFGRFFSNKISGKIKDSGYDIIFVQTSTLLTRVNAGMNTICRLGANRTFDSAPSWMIDAIKRCFCVVATNKKLYDIARQIHDRVYLVTNGLDLSEWSRVRRTRKKVFIVGFCGNITRPDYRDYKGFDYIEAACKNLGIELKTALYNNEQIPHDKMRELFYGKIDCIVHPTKGEGCSNTLMEACACGVPIITTTTAGYHGELMTDGENVLFCERSTESVQAAINKLMTDKGLYRKLSSGARAFAEEHHDVNKISAEYEKIFSECHEANIRCGVDRVDIMRSVKTPEAESVVYKINGRRVFCMKFPVETSKAEMIQHIKEKHKDFKG